MSPAEEIKHLYFNTTRSTIERDFARAIDLLKAMPGDEARERVAVYMDGLAEMRTEWRAGPTARSGAPARRRSPGSPR
jgi:hypothetical protein